MVKISIILTNYFEKIDEIFFEFTLTEITPTIYSLFDKVIRMNENYKDKIQAMIEELFLTILNIEQPTTTLLLSFEHNKIDFVEKNTKIA